MQRSSFLRNSRHLEWLAQYRNRDLDLGQGYQFSSYRKGLFVYVVQLRNESVWIV